MWGKKGSCQSSAQLPPALFLPPGPQLHPPLQSYQAFSLLLLESVLSCLVTPGLLLVQGSPAPRVEFSALL